MKFPVQEAPTGKHWQVYPEATYNAMTVLTYEKDPSADAFAPSYTTYNYPAYSASREVEGPWNYDSWVQGMDEIEHVEEEDRALAEHYTQLELTAALEAMPLQNSETQQPPILDDHQAHVFTPEMKSPLVLDLEHKVYSFAMEWASLHVPDAPPPLYCPTTGQVWWCGAQFPSDLAWAEHVIVLAVEAEAHNHDMHAANGNTTLQDSEVKLGDLRIAVDVMRVGGEDHMPVFEARGFYGDTHFASVRGDSRKQAAKNFFTQLLRVVPDAKRVTDHLCIIPARTVTSWRGSEAQRLIAVGRSMKSEHVPPAAAEAKHALQLGESALRSDAPSRREMVLADKVAELTLALRRERERNAELAQENTDLYNQLEAAHRRRGDISAELSGLADALRAIALRTVELNPGPQCLLCGSQGEGYCRWCFVPPSGRSASMRPLKPVTAGQRKLLNNRADPEPNIVAAMAANSQVMSMAGVSHCESSRSLYCMFNHWSHALPSWQLILFFVAALTMAADAQAANPFPSRHTAYATGAISLSDTCFGSDIAAWSSIVAGNFADGSVVPVPWQPGDRLRCRIETQMPGDHNIVLTVSLCWQFSTTADCTPTSYSVDPFSDLMSAICFGTAAPVGSYGHIDTASYGLPYTLPSWMGITNTGVHGYEFETTVPDGKSSTLKHLAWGISSMTNSIGAGTNVLHVEMGCEAMLPTDSGSSSAYTDVGTASVQFSTVQHPTANMLQASVVNLPLNSSNGRIEVQLSAPERSLLQKLADLGTIATGITNVANYLGSTSGTTISPYLSSYLGPAPVAFSAGDRLQDIRTALLSGAPSGSVTDNTDAIRTALTTGVVHADLGSILGAVQSSSNSTNAVRAALTGIVHADLVNILNAVRGGLKLNTSFPSSLKLACANSLPSISRVQRLLLPQPNASPAECWPVGRGNGQLYDVMFDVTALSPVKPTVTIAVVATSSSTHMGCTNYTSFTTMTTLNAPLRSEDSACGLWQADVVVPELKFDAISSAWIWLCSCSSVPAKLLTHISYSATGFLSRKERNRLQHALNGNMSSKDEDWVVDDDVKSQSTRSDRSMLSEKSVVFSPSSRLLSDAQREFLRVWNRNIAEKALATGIQDTLHRQCWPALLMMGMDYTIHDSPHFDTLDDIDEPEVKDGKEQKAGPDQTSQAKKEETTRVKKQHDQVMDGRGHGLKSTVGGKKGRDRAMIFTGWLEDTVAKIKSWPDFAAWASAPHGTGQAAENVKKKVLAKLPPPQTISDKIHSMFARHMLSPLAADRTTLYAEMATLVPAMVHVSKNVAWNDIVDERLDGIIPVLEDRKTSPKWFLLPGQLDPAKTTAQAIQKLSHAIPPSAAVLRQHVEQHPVSVTEERVRAVEADAHNKKMHAMNGNTEEKKAGPSMYKGVTTTAESLAQTSIRSLGTQTASGGPVDARILVNKLTGLSSAARLPSSVETIQHHVMRLSATQADGTTARFNRNVLGSQWQPRQTYQRGALADTAQRLMYLNCGLESIVRKPQTLSPGVFNDLKAFDEKGTNKEDVLRSDGFYKNDLQLVCSDVDMSNSAADQDWFVPFKTLYTLGIAAWFKGRDCMRQFPVPGNFTQHDPHAQVAYGAGVSAPVFRARTYDPAAVFGESCGGGATRFPFAADYNLNNPTTGAAAQGLIAFHTTHQSVPTGEMEYALALPKDLLSQRSLGTSSQIIALMAASVAACPFFFQYFRINTRPGGGGGEALAPQVHRSQTIFTSGTNILHIVMPNKRTARLPDDAGAQTAPEFGVPTSGPSGSASMPVPFSPLHISSKDGVTYYDYAEYLYSWFNDRTDVPVAQVPSYQQIWLMMRFLARRVRRLDDMRAAIEFVNMHSVTYSPLWSAALNDLFDAYAEDSLDQQRTYGADFIERNQMAFDFDANASQTALPVDIMLPNFSINNMSRLLMRWVVVDGADPVITSATLPEYMAVNLGELIQYRPIPMLVAWQAWFVSRRLPASWWEQLFDNPQTRYLALKYQKLWRREGRPELSPTIECFMAALTGATFVRSDAKQCITDLRFLPNGFRMPKVWANEGDGTTLGDCVPVLMADADFFFWTGGKSYLEIPMFAPANSRPGQIGIARSDAQAHFSAGDNEGGMPVLKARSAIQVYGEKEVPLNDPVETYNQMLLLRARPDSAAVYMINSRHEPVGDHIPSDHAACLQPHVDLVLANVDTSAWTRPAAQCSFFNPCCTGDSVPMLLAFLTGNTFATMTRNIAGDIVVNVESLYFGSFTPLPAAIVGGAVEDDTDLAAQDPTPPASVQDFTVGSASIAALAGASKTS